MGRRQDENSRLGRHAQAVVHGRGGAPLPTLLRTTTSRGRSVEGRGEISTGRIGKAHGMCAPPHPSAAPPCPQRAAADNRDWYEHLPDATATHCAHVGYT
jgi:hypothetical protein